MWTSFLDNLLIISIYFNIKAFKDDMKYCAASWWTKSCVLEFSVFVTVLIFY